jgi:small-conductance mechanosensitive channel
LRSAVHYGLLALALLIASQQFGIEATSILALFGAVGFGLAFAGTFTDISAAMVFTCGRQV